MVAARVIVQLCGKDAFQEYAACAVCCWCSRCVFGKQPSILRSAVGNRATSSLAAGVFTVDPNPPEDSMWSRREVSPNFDSTTLGHRGRRESNPVECSSIACVLVIYTVFHLTHIHCSRSVLAKLYCHSHGRPLNMPTHQPLIGASGSQTHREIYPSNSYHHL